MLENINIKQAIDWINSQYGDEIPPFYSSVDIRNSGYKIAPVDTNLFPAGFNNLADLILAKKNTKEYLLRYYPNVKNILIIPENHTRNKGYIANLATIRRILQDVGENVEIGRMPNEIEADEVILEGREHILSSYQIKRDGNIIITKNGFKPDLIIVNNDFTREVPKILCDISQPLLPSPCVGWFRRRKSSHFIAYNDIVTKFAREFKIDSWQINAIFSKQDEVNFSDKNNLHNLAENVESVISQITEKYQEYNIKETPFVYVKADNGTYGMGVMIARSGDDVLTINKKTRNKMKIIKEGTRNSNVIIQEGIATKDMRDEVIAEPVIYLMAGNIVGGAWRINDGRDIYKNLNAANMYFEPMNDISNSNIIISRLASLATVREIHYINCCI